MIFFHLTLFRARQIVSVLCLSLFAFHGLSAQSFSTGHTQRTFIDETRNNREVAAEIYYPANSAGENTPLAIDNGNRFPVIAFGHGFFMGWDSYEYLWNLLTSHGYIVAFPTTESGLSPSHEDFGKDLALVIADLKIEGQTSTSFFFDVIDSTSCVMGHSMGGGAAHLAASYDPSITAIATLAAAETNPSAISAAASITIPTLIFAGANDCITPIPEHQQPIYDAFASSCKTMVTVTGASHCQFAGSNFACSFGELTCSPAAAISAADQQALVAEFLIPWLNNYLKYDCEQGIVFQNLLQNQGISYQQNCTVCSSVRIDHVADEFATISLENNLIVIKSNLNQNLELRITDISGKVVSAEVIEGKSGNEYAFNLSDYSGLYIISVSDGRHLTSIKKVINLN
jgi:hypothetical protein